MTTVLVKRLCAFCSIEIPEERLEVLPETRTCVGCSREKKMLGTMVFDHKTAPRMVLINPDDKEGLRRAQRFSSRARK